MKIVEFITSEWTRIVELFRENWRRAIREIINTITMVIANFIYWLLFFGFILYTVLNYETLQAQPFELAKVSALLGGFALAGGFSGIKTLANLAHHLRRIGASYIVSTLFWVLFGLYQSLDKPDAVESLKDTLKIVIPASFYGGLVFFLIGTLLLVLIVPRIYREK